MGSGGDFDYPLMKLEPSRSAAVKNTKIHELENWRVWLLWPLSAVMKLWGRTMRIRGETPEDLVRMRDTGRPTVVLFWHNRLFLAAEGYRRYRKPHPMFGLVSASRDGAWLAAFFRLAGLGAVRGSSSRRGREALRELIRRVREGADVAITPDGPRGPVYSFKAGPAAVARGSGGRLLLVGALYSRAWHLKSWDRFVLPCPFSKVTLRTEIIDPDGMPADAEAFTERLRERLLALNGLS